MGAVDVTAEFEAVFHRLYPRARTVAHRILGDRGEAEDAAAEAFARALVAWRRVGDLPYLDAWILRVTANVSVDTVRRRKALPVAAVADTAASAGPDDVTVLRMALVAALAALPRRQREVIALRYLVGLSEEEIAASLGVSSGSVKRHAHRGMDALRRRMGVDWDPSRVEGVAGVA